MRKLFGKGTPRGPAGPLSAIISVVNASISFLFSASHACRKICRLDGSLPRRLKWFAPRHENSSFHLALLGRTWWHSHNVFFRDGERVFRTYFINSRGDEAMGTTWNGSVRGALSNDRPYRNSHRRAGEALHWPSA